MLQAVFIPAELLKQFRVLQSYQFNVSITRGLRNKFCHAKETQRPYHIKIRRLPRNKSCSMSTDTASKYADFFRYTSGRWLWDEEEQLLDRYKAFNVPELQRIAAESVGANLCVSMTKLGEGNYNKVFRLAMDNGLAIIARIPNPNAGPAGYTTASEVATMDLARTILQIPVPKVFAWSSTMDNPVGSEYIIMEEAKGMALHLSWDNMEFEQKCAIVEGVVTIEEKLRSVSFTRYGSIYYASDGFEGCEKAEIIGDIPEALRKEVEARFLIGPIIERDFWSKERLKMNIDRGPWKAPNDYVTAIAHREIAWISKYAVSKPLDDPSQPSKAQNSPEAHISLLQKFLKVAPYLLPQDTELAASTLWHRDIHAGNIFVGDGLITSLIDWQATWAGPLIIQARHPRLLNHKGEIMLRRPENFNELDEEERDRLNEQVASSILLHVYETQTAKQNPVISGVYRFSHGKTRMQPILFAGDTWTDDIIPLRESLIKVERCWSEFNINMPCPFHFSAEEIQSHRRDGEGWNKVQDFWDSVAGFINREGWTSNETYAEAREFFFELRQDCLKNMTGKEREWFEAQTRWAEKPN